MLRWFSCAVLALLIATLDGEHGRAADYLGRTNPYAPAPASGYSSGYVPEAWGTGNQYPSFPYAAYPRYGFFTGGVWEDGVGVPAPFIGAYHFNPVPNFAGFRPEQQNYPSRTYTPEGPVPDRQVKPNIAIVEVRLPAHARLSVEGTATDQTGSDRFFTSPSLVPGKEYVYHLKAVWTDARGRPIEQERTVDVRAGKHVTVDFGSRSR